MPAEEAAVYLRECELQLLNVDFETYQGAIKRFGYKIDLNDQHMEKIAPEIRLNYQQMCQVSASPYAVVYKDANMFFKEKRHNVPKLIRLGFILCRHYSPETQILEMWHIINPKLEENVSKQAVQAFLEDLLYVAIDMNLSKCLQP
jgi:hypothetical protein